MAVSLSSQRTELLHLFIFYHHTSQKTSKEFFLYKELKSENIVHIYHCLLITVPQAFHCAVCVFLYLCKYVNIVIPLFHEFQPPFFPPIMQCCYLFR